MDRNFTGLSQEQQNDCRTALQKFMDRHEISDWGTTIKVEETAPGKYSVKIEITPAAETGLRAWAIKEVAVADATLNVAVEIDKMLELGYQDRFALSKMQ